MPSTHFSVAARPPVDKRRVATMSRRFVFYDSSGRNAAQNAGVFAIHGVCVFCSGVYQEEKSFVPPSFNGSSAVTHTDKRLV